MATTLKGVYMRGGTSKGLFFLKEWLPEDPVARDRLLLRAMGSPDPFATQIDGMGGATSSTSKVVIISRSQRADSDVDYLFGQVAINQPTVDWSGNCGNLTAAVGPFAVSQGLVHAPENGMAEVRIWQANIHARIISHFPMRDGIPQEEGDFQLDGIPFPGAEIVIDYLDPCGASDSNQPVFPTGNVIDSIDVPGIGPVSVTMMNAANPAVFIHASTLGLSGTELPVEINGNQSLLAQAELIRATAAVRMGLAKDLEDASRNRLHTPKLIYLAKPTGYLSTGGVRVEAETLDVNARIFSMGKLHHAMTGTGAIGIAAAAAIPGTLVQQLLSEPRGQQLTMGHPAGRVQVGVKAENSGSQWRIVKATMSRTARRIMVGEVFVPNDVV
ncbi:2-methylaconitate cis-trans isomerase PrpF [Leminorella grimontii]|uniref:2-methylaconitate cis-trans isomerase PrpF n=1 Tax=Leminorella grimontii TaxID=82981 RepID=UPI00322085FA